MINVGGAVRQHCYGHNTLGMPLRRRPICNVLLVDVPKLKVMMRGDCDDTEEARMSLLRGSVRIRRCAAGIGDFAQASGPGAVATCGTRPTQGLVVPLFPLSRITLLSG